MIEVGFVPYLKLFPRGAPELRGRLTPDRPLAELTWLRVGGPADWLYQPADEDDLRAFLAALAPSVPVFPMGVGSNLIVRDGGLRGVTIRLGRGFNGVRVEGDSSGDMEFTDIGRDVWVERDSSGDIVAREVGGNFTVDRDGSGEIHYSDVTGSVSIPDDKS